MLGAVSSSTRLSVDLSGLFRASWGKGLSRRDLLLGRGFEAVLAVPGAWSRQRPELREFPGPLWYASEFGVPGFAAGTDAVLRFQGINDRAEVFVNGRLAGEHSGGGVPFDVDISECVHFNVPNALVVRVEAGGGGDGAAAGIVRPVKLLLLPRERLLDFRFRVEQSGGAAVLEYEAVHSGSRVEVELGGERCSGEKGRLRVEDAPWWSPGRPVLLPLSVRVYGTGGALSDEYVEKVGLRTVTAGDEGLKVNGRPLRLRAVWRPEDFPVLGEGEAAAVCVWDAEAAGLAGFDAIHTGWRPPSEALASACDATGMMLVAQCPEAPGIWDAFGPRRNGSAEAAALRSEQKRLVRETVCALRRHPSVVAWSVGPALPREDASLPVEAAAFVRELALEALDADPSRPVVLVEEDGERPGTGSLAVFGKEGGSGGLLRREDCGMLCGCLADYAGKGAFGWTEVREEGMMSREREPREVFWEARRKNRHGAPDGGKVETS